MSLQNDNNAFMYYSARPGSALANTQALANQSSLYGLGGLAQMGQMASMTRQARGIYDKSKLETDFGYYMHSCDALINK